MTALDFPNSPAYGDIYNKYKWDGEKWLPWFTTLVGISPPTILTGLIGWWDASIYGSISFSGANVTSLADQSGAGNAMTGHSLAWPTYSATGLNSLPTFNFSAGTSFDNNSFPFGTGNTMTVFMVCQFANVNSGNARVVCYRVGAHEYDNNSSWYLYRDAATTFVDFGRSGNTINGADFSAYNTPRRCIITVKSDGTHTVYVDGVASSSTFLAGTAFGSPGALTWFNVYNGGTSPMTGQLSEFGIATGFANAAAVAALDTYLANKWGLNAVTNFLARTTGLDTTHINAYTALIDGLVADGVWPLLDVLYIFATQDATTALLNLKSASYTATAVNAPTFTTDRGYTGAITGSKYLSTNFNPSTAGGQFTQNSAHLSIWTLTAAGSAYPAIGGQTGGGANNAYIFAPNYTDNNFYNRINSNATGGGIANPVSNSAGHYLGNRTASNSVNGYRNGSATGMNPSATTSVTMPNITLYALGSNVAGTVNPADMQATMASIGAALDATKSLAFYNRLRTYMTAVGVP